MNIGPILELLNHERKLDLRGDYYARVRVWEDWWKGYHRPFHRYREQGANGKAVERDLFTLKMAKKICEDWASLLLNEKTEITLGDTASQKFLEDVFGQNQFWFHANQLVEKAFYSGTGAIVLHLDGFRNGGDPGASVWLDYLPASQIVPLTVRHGCITEAAFCSEAVEQGKRYLYLEVHTLEGGGYVVENRRFEDRDGLPVPAALPDGLAPRFETRSSIPLFAILRPNCLNSFPEARGLGVSIFAGAIDCLKGVDLAFNNFCRDYQLGGKKVFLNRDLMARGEDGTLFTPDDICQQLFTFVGDKGPDDQQLFVEHNPDLRVADNAAGLQAQLDYLSFKCGLGTKRYRFDSGGVVTATQYLGENQELAQNVRKQCVAVEQFLQSVARAVLWAGKNVLGLGVDPDAEVSVQFDDSVIVDKQTERMQDKEDVRDGVMRKWEFRVKWYGEDEATAKRMVPDDDESEDEVMGFADAGTA